MNPVAVTILAVQAVVFALWSFVAFRSLFRLLAVVRRSSGQSLPGLRSTLSAPRIFLTDPGFAADRKALLALSVALLILSLGFAATH